MTLRELLNQKLGETCYTVVSEEFSELRINTGVNDFRITNALNVEKILGCCLVSDDDSRQLEKLLRGEQWDGRGLPPVGTVCQWDNGENDWCDVKVMGVDGDEVWVKPLDGSQSFVVCDGDFKPLADERDLAISKLMQDSGLRRRDGSLEVAQRLYDAGWRKHDDI